MSRRTHPVGVIFTTTCEGYYAREGELNLGENDFGGIDNRDLLYGVYRIPPASQLAHVEDWRGAKYAIVLNRIGPTDAVLVYAIISDGEAILGTATGCGETPEQWADVQGLGEPILIPD